MKPEPERTAAANERWNLIRDVVVFECKLIADGFRDLVLFPVSLIAAIISLLGKGEEFYELLRLGRRSERWINLFGELDRKAGDASEQDNAERRDFDEIVSKVEAFLVEEYRKGGVTAQAKRHMDDALDRLQGMRKRRDGSQRIA